MFVCVCKTSSVRYPDIPVLPSGKNVCCLYQNFLFNWHFLHLIPTRFVFLTVIQKHNITTALISLVAWGFQKFLWTLSISLPAFSPNISYGSQDIYMTALNSSFCHASLSHVSITAATTSMPSGWIVLCCGGDNVFYTIHKHKLHTNRPECTLTH